SLRRKNISDDDGRLAAHEIGRQPWKPIGLIVSPAKVDGNVLALDESGLLQALSQRGDKLLRAGSRCAAEKAEHWNHRLLRPRRERHAAAAPPSSVMNSRLFIRSPRRRGRARLAGFRARALSRS